MPVGLSNIWAVAHILGVSNATGKVFAAGLQVDPGGKRPCPSDAAFSNFSEADWKILHMLRLNGPGQLGPTICLPFIPALIIPAIIAPSVFKGYWFEFVVCLITYYAACVPWWGGVTGHFILCCPAMMLQLKNMRDELLVLVAGAEGKDIAATWRKSLSIKSSKDLSKVAPNPDAESQSATIARSVIGRWREGTTEGKDGRGAVGGVERGRGRGGEGRSNAPRLQREGAGRRR